MITPNRTRFVITKDHLKLLKRLNVHNASGRAQIDFYRPYGNSDFVRDIAEILKWKINKDGEISAVVTKKALKIDKELATALQICLQFGRFKTGEFTSDTYGTWFKK